MRAASEILKRFTRNDDGAVLVVFALCLTTLMFMAALAVDTARAWKTESTLREALDATALATARAMRLEGLNDAELKARADNYFSTAFKQRSADTAHATPLQLEIDRSISTAKVSSTVALPTFLAGLMGLKQFEIAETASARFDPKNLEIAMTLDVSGSMFGQKIADLKSAASELVKTIIEDNSTGATNRIGIAPYSTAINAGAYAVISSGKADKTTCVTERKGNKSKKDSHPNNGKMGKKSEACPFSTVEPLSDNADSINSWITALSAKGATAGHLGIAWGWYILSPKWASIWPSASQPAEYEDDKTIKSAVIMTDGMFNTAYEDDEGDSAEQAKALCEGMKDQGIRVFTVAFDAPPQVLPLLKECASEAKYFYNAKDGQALRTAFSDIASKLTALRLTN